MVAKLLTDISVSRIKADPERRLEIPDRQQPGLYLVIQPSGKRAFAVRTRIAGKSVKLTIGDPAVVDLTEARRVARDAVRTAQRGADPRQERAAADANTVQAVVTEFVARYAKPRLKTWHDVETRLQRDLVRVYGSRPIADLGRGDIVRLLDQMTDRGMAQGANRTLAIMRRMFGWCVERGLLAASPCDGVRPPAKEVARDRLLTDDELVAVWRACGGLGWPFGPLIRLMLATGQRRAEVAGLRRQTVDTSKALWTLPREATKSGREHAVPLSDLALEVLASVPNLGRDLVFSTNGRTAPSGWGNAKARLDRLSGVAGWRLHDLRRCAASGMARMGHPPHVVAAILNHTPGALMGVTAIYNRFRYDDEKRAALDAWARHIQRVVNGATAEVVALQA